MATKYLPVSNACEKQFMKWFANANTEIIFSFETPARDAKQETKEKVYKELIAQGLKYYTVFENLPDGTRKQVVLFPSAKISYGNKSVAVNFLKSSPGADADQNLIFLLKILNMN